MFTKKSSGSLLSALLAPVLWLFAAVGALTLAPRLGRLWRLMPWRRTA